MINGYILTKLQKAFTELFFWFVVELKGTCQGITVYSVIVRICCFANLIHWKMFLCVEADLRECFVYQADMSFRFLNLSQRLLATNRKSIFMRLLAEGFYSLFRFLRSSRLWNQRLEPDCLKRHGKYLLLTSCISASAASLNSTSNCHSTPLFLSCPYRARYRWLFVLPSGSRIGGSSHTPEANCMMTRSTMSNEPR